ncbi:hypothetical protein RJ640_028642 [Escallonia rubra]|uniref:RNA-binding protein AU-1/Ribonuclease E/G domain-containing protein n=1 Tax=Escallonia rubra TaxID=112253 RepID=A0AA88UP28_9ASTE|nr:hypothetical protein RJ640_028642 [Escallonia rubra]
MVILMSPTRHTNLWNPEAKLSTEENFKGTCHLKGDTWPPGGVIGRIKPESFLSVHSHCNQSRYLLARYPWFRSHTSRLPSHALGSWMVQTWLPLRTFISARAKDQEKIVNGFDSDSLVSKHSLSEMTAEGKICPKSTMTVLSEGSASRITFAERYHPVEEPWLLHSSFLSHRVAQSDVSSGLTDEEQVVKFPNLEPESSDQSVFAAESYFKAEDTINGVNKSFDANRTLPVRDHPIEEPWLFPSSLSVPRFDAKVVFDVSKNEGSIKDEAADSDHHHQVPGSLFPDAKSCINQALTDSGGVVNTSALQENPVSTVILINSSLCTMQRIAILEDEKLVELLLEPVKNNVQSDSVYLGAVTKLVPHMGGAFVNIGSSRPSLMDIRPSRKPFIFPPFRRRRKEREVNGSGVGEPREHHGVNDNGHNTDDIEVLDDNEEHEVGDDSVQYTRDDFAEHEVEDDFDVLEDAKENHNGSLVDYGAEIDSERQSDQLGKNEHHIEGQTFGRSPLVDIGFSDSSHLQDMNDPKDPGRDESKWSQVRKGTKIIVQVVKEGLGTKGPTLTAFPKLRSRFWVLSTRCNNIGISKKISGVERTRLRVIAKTLQPPGYGLTVRTVAAGRSLEELQKDLEGLLSTWKGIEEHAKSAALAADEGVEGAIPVILHRAMGQTLSVVQDYFNEKVKRMVVDSPRIYHEVTNYLQEIAPELCDRVELYSKRAPIFDEFSVEEELNSILGKRVPLSNGGYLVIEQTEALVSIDVNGGHCMLGQGTSQEKAILDVNLAAAKQIAREIRLRDIGGIIVVDFIDMVDDSNKRLVYEEVKKSVERDRSTVKVSELSRHGLMEITRKRVRPSLTFMVSEPCTFCHATGRVEALETSFSKIEHEICRLIALVNQKADPGDPKSWPKFILKVDRYMCNYLTSGKRTRLAVLSSSLKVWILLKVARGFTRGAFELKQLTEDKDHKGHQVAISMLRPTEVGNYAPRGNVTIFPIKKWKTGGK